MLRVIIFLVVIAAAALGATWLADQSGTLTLVIDRWQIETSLPVFVLATGILVAAMMMAWSLLRFLWRLPQRAAAARQRRRIQRGRDAITRGLVAIGSGDALAARRQAQRAKSLASDDALSLVLRAQAAQLAGDHAEAREAFHDMASRSDTRLFGLRGLFVEAQRSDDPLGAVAVAEEALKLTPSSGWASQAVLGFRCAKGDWNGALAIIDSNKSSGLLANADWRRQRAVLLTAQALDLESSDRDRSRTLAIDALKLAPTLIPAAVLAAKFYSENGEVRRAMRAIEPAWRAQPHPDLADAYVHVRLGDAARERLVRAETLATRAPGEREGALAVARAAIDATEYARARAALAPFIAAPTQRVAMLMAELERAEHDDDARAREWTLRAVRAAHDPAWTADGYVSDRWRPVSPVTGRLDAFQWVVPVAALPGAAPVEATPVARSAPLPPPVAPSIGPAASRPEASPVIESVPVPPAPQPVVPPAVFRTRADFDRLKPAAPVPPVVAMTHPPDDPGIDGEDDPEAAGLDARGQEGGFQGFLSRMRR